MNRRRLAHANIDSDDKPRGPEISGAPAGNADSTLPVKRDKRWRSFVRSNSTFDSRRRAGTVRRVTLTSGSTKPSNVFDGRFHVPALELPAWFNRLWRLIRMLGPTHMFVKRIF